MHRFTRRAGTFYPVFSSIDNPFSILLFYLRHFYIAVFGLKKCNIEPVQGCSENYFSDF